MIQVPNEVKQAFHSDYDLKGLIISLPNYESAEPFIIVNSEIISESFNLDESLCSEGQLRLGACEASSVSFEVQSSAIPRDLATLSGEIIDLFLIFDSVPDYTFTIGRYVVYDDQMSNDHLTREITAYDMMYYVRNCDVSEWYYNQLEFPMTMKEYRNSFFNYITSTFGIPIVQNEVNLINDMVTLPARVFNINDDGSFEQIVSSDVIEMICAFNGVFGHVNRNNEFVYIKLYEPGDATPLFPGPTTFPGGETYPGSTFSNAINIDGSFIRENITWQTYACLPADSVELRNSSSNSVARYSSKTDYQNEYVVTNWLFNNLDTGTLNTIAYNILNSIKGIFYTPCSFDTLGDLSLEVGDAVVFPTDDGSLHKTFILMRSLSGIQNMFDNFSADGPMYFEFDQAAQDANSGKIEEIKEDVTDLDNRVSELENIGSSIKVVSVTEEPSSPVTGTLYLIQGTVVIK